MTPEDFDAACEIVAQRVLHDAGSDLNHYMPQTKQRILLGVRPWLQDIYRKGLVDGLETNKPNSKE